MANEILLWIKQRWRLLFVILVPLVSLPLPIVNKTSQASCGYVVLILITYWISEVIPLPVTSLLPLLLFPMTGVLRAKLVAECYFKDIIALIFGRLAFAHAFESVNLHRRIALFVLKLVGTSTKRAMGGLMAVTAFISMWINNSAATTIMLPVALAISDELERHGKNYHGQKQVISETTPAVEEVLKLTGTEIPNGHTTKEVILQPFDIEEPEAEVLNEVKNGLHSPWNQSVQLQVVQPHEQKYEEIKKGIWPTWEKAKSLQSLSQGFLFATAYSAAIGGLSSLVGTSPNIFVKGFIENTYKGTAFHVNFFNFLIFAFPVAILMLIFCWLWLQIFYNRKELFQCRTDPETRELQTDLKTMLAKQYNDLGKPKWSEYCIAIIFISMILLWLTREFGETRGWGILFRDQHLSDSTVAVFCGVLPLILPNVNPLAKNWKYEPIVAWKNLVRNMPWGVLFLLGAGLSIALAFTSSGLSESVAQAFRFLTGIPHAAVILTIIIITALFTEVTSNLSTVSMFLPVLDSVARSSGIHPGFLILPCTLAVSLAFMLPIATASNAIIFSSGAIRVIDMIKTGVVMNIIGFFVIFLAAMTWMPKIYGLDDRATEIFFSMNTTTLATATMKTIG